MVVVVVVVPAVDVNVVVVVVVVAIHAVRWRAGEVGAWGGLMDSTPACMRDDDECVHLAPGLLHASVQ